MKQTAIVALTLICLLAFAGCRTRKGVEQEKLQDAAIEAGTAEADAGGEKEAPADTWDMSETEDGSTEEKPAWHQIDQETAKRMMEEDDGHVVVDVRRQDEYDEGHIPGAILIPNETIGSERPEELPDLDQIILIYCRSGNRSKQAADKLAALGYTNLYEFGGIREWTGEVVKEEQMEAVNPTPVLVIRAGEKTFYADFEENSSAEAFAEQLSSGELELELHDYGGFEKVGSLPWNLPRNDTSITTEPGDVILYQGNQITIYYDKNTWNFTRLAKIGNTSRDALLEALGEGSVTVSFSVEWSE